MVQFRIGHIIHFHTFLFRSTPGEPCIFRCSYCPSRLTPCLAEIVLITTEAASAPLKVELVLFLKDGLKGVNAISEPVWVSTFIKFYRLHLSKKTVIPSTSLGLILPLISCRLASQLPLGVSFPPSSRLRPASLDTSNLCGLAAGLDGWCSFVKRILTHSNWWSVLRLIWHWHQGMFVIRMHNCCVHVHPLV